MRILITAGIYTPEVGGTATYVPKIADELIALGHTVDVITYSDLETFETDKDQKFTVERIVRKNTLSNYWRYLRAVLRKVKQYDVLYSFDHMSAGIPSILASKLHGKPVVIRIGGDFIWERYLRKTGAGVSLRDYYVKKLHKKDPIRFGIIKYVFNKAAKLIFTTTFQAEIFQKNYGFSKEKIAYVNNPVPPVPATVRHEKKNNNILFAGRMINKNNVHTLIDAFAKSQKDPYELIIVGNGEERARLEKYVEVKQIKHITFTDRVSRDNLWLLMQDCHAVIFPSLTDISPNTMLDCVGIGTPFITSVEIGYEWVIAKGKTFDPRSSDDMANALSFIMDESEYEEYRKKMQDLNYTRTFVNAAKETEEIFSKL
jgi:glycosyltransferase involved in cell wall biosynthesis